MRGCVCGAGSMSHILGRSFDGGLAGPSSRDNDATSMGRASVLVSSFLRSFHRPLGAVLTLLTSHRCSGPFHQHLQLQASCMACQAISSLPVPVPC